MMIGAIIQARMGSSRLHGKIMMKIRDKPLLYYVINQVKNSEKLSNIVIATSILKQDDIVFDYVTSLGVNCFRGHPEDLLDRYYQCAKQYKVEIIIRVTSDCPLIDPEIIDECISKFLEDGYDYFSNVIKKQNDKWIYDLNGFPAGQAVEVFTFKALEKAWKIVKKSSEREHVSFIIENNPCNFRCASMENSRDLSKIRLTVDHKIDFDLIKNIIENFPEKEIFNIENVIAYLEKNPELKQMNAHIPFNEGYLKSLE